MKNLQRVMLWCIAMLLCAGIYWLTGWPWQRSPEFAYCVLVAAALSVCAVMVSENGP